MSGQATRQVLSNITSPYGVATASYALFVIAWLFPPTLYTYFLKEQDLLFLNMTCFFFYTSCVITFCLGVWACRYVQGSSQHGLPATITASSPVLLILIPLGLATVLCLEYLVQIGGRIDFISLLASSQGDAIKQSEEPGAVIAGRWDMVPPMLTAVLGWAYFRVRQLEIRGRTKLICYTMIILATLVNIANDVARVDRAQLMPLVASLIIVFIFFKTRSATTTMFRLVLLGAGALTIVIAVFMFLSLSRGIVSTDALVSSLLGYTTVSYNRLAALILGSMHYAYEGSGVYVIPFLSQSAGLNKVFPFGETFGWPGARELWRSEFLSTAQAGLNPGFIWSGTFGYLYSDLGWYTVLYTFFYGLFSGYCWVKFKTGKAFGVIIYPWVAFSVLFWFGVNFLFYDRLLNYIELFVVLAWYERLFLHEPNALIARVDLRGSGRAEATMSIG